MFMRIIQELADVYVPFKRIEQRTVDTLGEQQSLAVRKVMMDQVVIQGPARIIQATSTKQHRDIAVVATKKPYYSTGTLL